MIIATTREGDLIMGEGRMSKSVHLKREAFLAAYSEVGTITHAAQLAGVLRTAHYNWMNDPEYVERFREAEKQACDRLEQEIRRRAVSGVDEPVFYQGKECGTVKKYSDTLLIFLAKGAMPQKYRDNVKMELTGQNGGGVEVELTSAELERKIKELLGTEE